jgi:OmpA-OmpF porin, OOP family
MNGIMNKVWLLVLMVTVPFSQSFAQSKYQRGSLGFHTGTTQYQGELRNDFYRFETTNPFTGLSYSHYASPLIDLKGSLMMGSWGYRHSRLNSFDVNVLSVFIEGKVKLRKADDPVVMPYVFGGIGAQHYSNWSLTNYLGNEIELDPRGDLISPSEVNGIQSSASLGAGVQFRFAERVFLSLEERFVFPGLDIADGLAGKYPDRMLMHTISLSFGLFNWKDSDGDLISDKKDRCPDTPKIAAVDEHGCPIDADSDGVPDFADLCPLVAGSSQTHGCIDTDGDAVADSIDLCPQTAGLLKFRGCPDADGDDVTDAEDDCPDQFGLLTLNGCPDDDNDGIRNTEDLCPATPQGVKTNQKGCAIDTDKDLTPDYLDKCPLDAGPETNQGCPEIKEEVKAIFQKALTGIKFETGKETLLKESFAILDSVVVIMNANPLYNLCITGHTDNAGDAQKNLELSDRRAKSVEQYLTVAGVDRERILEATGYGSTVPVADNGTKAGRALNRRVEFEVVY